MIKRISHAAISVAIGITVVLGLTALPLLASQNNLYNATTGTLSGLSMVQGFNNALDSVNTCNSGASAPSNQLSGSPSAGNCWYNTSTGAVNFYDGTNWLTVGYIDATNHVFTPIVGGGAAAAVASASTTNLCGSAGAAPTQSFLSITGATTITSFGANCAPGQIKILSFASTPQLTYSAGSMILPTAANITAAAGDIAVAIYLGSGNWQVAIYQRATGSALSSVGLSLGAASIASSALASFGQPVNLQLNAAVASNQLTVAVKGVNGADPSASNPVLVGFRDASSTGTVVAGSVQSVLSFTVSSTSSMGCTTAVTCRLWVELICQTVSAGSCTSILVGLSVQSSANACYPINEAGLQSTGSGTGGGTTINTIQTSVSALSNKPIRIVGYIEATWVSGTGWSTTPTNIQIFGPGVARPCTVVAEYFAPLTSLVSGSVTAYSTPTLTPPTPANGLSVISQQVIPQSAADQLVIEGSAYLDANSAGNQGAAFLYNGTNVLTAGYCTTPGSATFVTTGICKFKYQTAAATTSQITYTLYAIMNFSSNLFVNGTNDNTNSLFGLTNKGSTTYLHIWELMGALSPPTNNDHEMLRAVG